VLLSQKRVEEMQNRIADDFIELEEEPEALRELIPAVAHVARGAIPP